MQFFEPLNLAWLGLLVPVIVFFYLLKLRRQEQRVSSVMLWARATQDFQANAPFQRLRRSLLLLLQLAIAAFAVLALSRPAYLARALGGSSVVLILDASASMQSRDADGSRFDAARRFAGKLIQEMRGGDRAMLILAGSRARRLTGLVSDRSELRRALSSAEPLDGEAELRDALLLAVSVAGSREPEKPSQTRILVLSDGAYPELEGIDPRGCQIQFVKFGSRSRNIGITAMDARRLGEDRSDSGYQLFLALRNFGPEARKCTLELYRDDTLVDARPVSLPAADTGSGYSQQTEVLNLSEGAGVLKARLDLTEAQDDLAVDNEAYVTLSRRRQLKVLLVSDGNLYLERALNSIPRIQLSRVSPGGYQGQGGYHVVIFENRGPARVGPGAHLYVNCGGPTCPAELTGRIGNSSVVDFQRDHPIFRFVQLQINMREARVARVRPWGQAVAEHESGTVMALGERGGVRSAYVGFPLLQSDLPLKIAFPILLTNLTQWLGSGVGDVAGLQTRTGRPVTLPVPEGITQVTVADPRGRRTTLNPRGRTVEYAETHLRGVYQVTAGSERLPLAVNLLNPTESATAPRDKIQLGRQPVLAGRGAVRTPREVWRWLLLAALFILGLEWWVYHRRI